LSTEKKTRKEYQLGQGVRGGRAAWGRGHVGGGEYRPEGKEEKGCWENSLVPSIKGNQKKMKKGKINENNLVRTKWGEEGETIAR